MLKCWVTAAVKSEPDQDAEFLGLTYEDDREGGCSAVVRIQGRLVVEIVHPSRVQFKREGE